MSYNTKIQKNSKNGARLLDNIAQLPTGPKIEGFRAQNSPKNKYNKKAKAKDYTQRINGPLCYLDSINHKSYARAYHCNNVLKYKKEDNKITSRYCNSRTCIICNKIRTAKLIKGYYKPLQDLMNNEPDKSLEFVTLTIPNCKKEDLDYTRDKIVKDLSNIIRVLNEKKGMDISGIRNNEITYNIKRDDYHPHIHLIVNKNSGQLIIDEWLKRYPDAAHWCQDIRKISDVGALLELFKYSTKFFIKDKKTGKMIIHAPAIDVIMCSLRKKRIIQPFGKLKKLEEEVSEEVEQLISEELDKIYNLEEDAEIVWNEENKNYYIEYVRFNISKSILPGSPMIMRDRIKTDIQFTFYKPPDEEKFEIYY